MVNYKILSLLILLVLASCMDRQNEHCQTEYIKHKVKVENFDVEKMMQSNGNGLTYKKLYFAQFFCYDCGRYLHDTPLNEETYSNLKKGEIIYINHY